MMNINPVETINLITGYSEEYLLIDKIQKSKKLFLSQDSILEHQIELESFDLSDIENIIKQIEGEGAQDEAIILINDDHGVIPGSIKSALDQKSISYVIASSSATYSTYNILTMEGRRIYALLF